MIYDMFGWRVSEVNLCQMDAENRNSIIWIQQKTRKHTHKKKRNCVGCGPMSAVLQRKEIDSITEKSAALKA